MIRWRVEMRYSGHSVYRTEYHIVWMPKYRRRILNPEVRGYLRKLFPKVIMNLPGCEIVEYHMKDDRSSTICCGRRNRQDERDDSEWVEEKVFLFSQGLLEREYSMITQEFCLNNRDRWRAGPNVFKMARDPGLRSSKDWILISATAVAVGIYKARKKWKV